MKDRRLFITPFFCLRRPAALTTASCQGRVLVLTVSLMESIKVRLCESVDITAFVDPGPSETNWKSHFAKDSFLFDLMTYCQGDSLPLLSPDCSCFLFSPSCFSSEPPETTSETGTVSLGRNKKKRKEPACASFSLHDSMLICLFAASVFSGRRFCLPAPPHWSWHKTASYDKRGVGVRELRRWERHLTRSDASDPNWSVRK